MESLKWNFVLHKLLYIKLLLVGPVPLFCSKSRPSGVPNSGGPLVEGPGPLN